LQNISTWVRFGNHTLDVQPSRSIIKSKWFQSRFSFCGWAK